MPDPGFSCVSEHHFIPVSSQTLSNCICQFSLIFDDQYMHCAIRAPIRCDMPIENFRRNSEFLQAATCSNLEKEMANPQSTNL